MYNSPMVRKQLYLRDDQDRLLKRLAKEFGLPEAEVVRQALDRFLSGTGPSPLPQAEEALQAFLEEADRLSQSHRFPEGWRFRREEFYPERGWKG